MRRPGIGLLLLMLLLGRSGTASSAALEPSADPVAAFIAVADSLHRTDAGTGFSPFITDNSILVGAAVARLLDDAFLVAADNPAGEKESVDLAGRIAVAHQAAGGSAVTRDLIDTYLRWGKSKRAQRAKAIDLEKQAGDARKAGDIPKAGELLTQARGIYEKLGDRHSVAVNWGTMGVTHWSAGDYDVVIADYEQALTARRAVEDHILEGRTLNGLGSAYQQKGDWNRAADYYRQAIELRRKTGDLTGLATSITYLGHVYNNTGRYVEARKTYEEALPMMESLNTPSPMVDLLSGIAAVNASIGRNDDSRDAYERAIALAAANGLVDKEILVRGSLADLHREAGRYADALDELAAAEALLASNPNPAAQARLHLNRGLTYMNMGELEDARDDLLKCAEMAKDLQDPSLAIWAQNDIAQLYRELGAYDRAIQSADKARELAEQAADGRSYRFALFTKGEAQFRLGHHDDALASWQEALAQDQADGADALALTDEVAIAGARAAKGETVEARKALHAVRSRARAAKLPIVERAVLNTLGHTFENDNPDSAAFYYELALANLESEAAQIGGSEVQTGYLSGKNRYYFEEVARYYAIQARAGDTDRQELWANRAFRTMERAKARGLLDLLRQSVAVSSTDEEDATLDALYSLDPARPDYASQRAALEAKYLELRRARVDAAVAGLAPAAATQVASTSPKTAGAAPAIVGIDETARVLPKKTVLFEYALGDSSSLLWVIDRDHRELHTLPGRAHVEAGVRQFRDAISKPGSGDEAMLELARSLYRMLLEPGQARLEKAQTLVIVPDGALFELPFDALIRGDAQPGAPISHQWFVARKYATVYAPSATVYARLRAEKREQEYARDLFAVGNPDFSALQPAGAAPLAPLPHAEQEVEAISSRIKTDRRTTLTGRGASEAAVKQELRREAPRVVHLATHGLVDAIEPARSSVALAPGEGEDGYLHTLEIISTPTTSDLVVMSACESARGRVSRGEGVVGLSRAFLGAGAGSVVASLWAVSDESTAELMRVFYEHMFGKKRPASRALQEARIALLEHETFSHPFYWSPFVVTGTERSPW